MARTIRATEDGMIYHILKRANGREKLFNKEKDYLTFEIIRNSIQPGSPFGVDSWIKKISSRLGLESTLKPRGRPKKGA